MSDDTEVVMKGGTTVAESRSAIPPQAQTQISTTPGPTTTTVPLFLRLRRLNTLHQHQGAMGTASARG